MRKRHPPDDHVLQLPLPLIVPCVRCGVPVQVAALYGRPLCPDCQRRTAPLVEPPKRPG